MLAELAQQLGALDQLAAGLSKDLASLDQTLTDANKLIKRVDTELVPSIKTDLEGLQRTLGNVDRTLKNADTTLKNADNSLFGPNAPAQHELRDALTEFTRAARSLRDEFAELPTSLAQARSFQSLGDRPLIVVTATRGAMAGWLPLQDEMAKLSTNSRHVVTPYEHKELIVDVTASRTSSQAILDVVHAVRFTAPL